MSQFFILLALVLIFSAYRYMQTYAKKNDPLYAEKLEQAHKDIGQLQTQLTISRAATVEQAVLLTDLQEKFEKLRFSKISGDVKLGQKAEHLLPFLEAFPYKDDEIKGLFQPIDLIVFRDDEVVFVEIKTGAASLTEKERRIRDNIKAGRVRFEVHRLNEKGVTVK